MFTAVMSLSSLSSGAHILKASAIGNRREQVWSAPVHFLVNRYPVITILSPKEGADVWRSIHVKADVSDDFGLRSVTINRQAFDKPPYELDLSLSLLSEDYEYSEYILFNQHESETWAGKSGVVVTAEDTLGLRLSVSPRIHIKRLFYADSLPPTFFWRGFFEHRHPEARYVKTEEGKPAIVPDIYSLEWSVVFSTDRVFQTTSFSSPVVDGPLVGTWKPSTAEWLAILGLGKERPSEDVPIYFRIMDGDGAVLWRDYFVVARAEPLTVNKFVTDAQGNKFPCGERTDHNAFWMLEVSDNPDFEGMLIYSSRHAGSFPPFDCATGGLISWGTVCKLQERYEELYVRFRAKDALGRETVTPIRLWPRIEDCYRYR